MESTQPIVAEEVVEKENKTEQELEIQPSTSRWDSVDWNFVNNFLYQQYADLSRNGSKYMRPMDIQLMTNSLSYINYEKDPYVEMYYYNKIKEKEEGNNNLTAAVPQFMTGEQKIQIAQAQMKSHIVAQLYSSRNQSLGICEKHNSRSQAPQLDIGDLERDDEATSKIAHLRILAAIENGYSSLLKMEELKKRLASISSVFEEIIIKDEMAKAKEQHLQSFFIEKKDDNTYDIKAKWFIRVMSTRKGKKLFLQSYSLFTTELWKLMLSYILPYLLIWSGEEDDKDIDLLVLQMIKEYLSSEFVDLDFITSIMEMFIKQKTYPLNINLYLNS